MRRAGSAALGLALALAAGCAGPRGPSDPPFDYRPNRRDYQAFRALYPDVLEPNYLPFMAHALPGPGAAGWSLVLCRWPDERMPLPVHVTPPDVPDSLQDEFRPRDPAAYTRAVDAALAMWEAELDGLVRFRAVERVEDALLDLVLVGEPAPEPAPSVKVLGETPGHPCHARGAEAAVTRFDVTFAVHRVRLYVADEHGLLAPDQVQWAALHEIGHALGMAGHSPIRADLMYRVARDRVHVPELSQQDVNSFVSLYQLPNGTVFARLPEEEVAPVPPPEGPPELALAPFVDTRLGFELKPPAGWTRVVTRRGMVAVDGTTWDYNASFQVVVERYAKLEDYLERYGEWYRQHRAVRRFEPALHRGRRAMQGEFETFDGRRFEQLTLIESGDGRVLVVIADCPPEYETVYRPWFAAALASLRIDPE